MIKVAKCGSPPAKAGRDMLQNRLDDMGVVVDAELIGHCQEQRVGLGDGLVLLELLDERVWLRSVAAAEDCALAAAEEPDLVLALVTAEIHPVAIVH